MMLETYVFESPHFFRAASLESIEVPMEPRELLSLAPKTISTAFNDDPFWSSGPKVLFGEDFAYFMPRVVSSYEGVTPSLITLPR